ncbi:DUF2141 domain-containing protein [Autumnicola musiva]|uniref:DUF2141 domain-containing protein n=1 Tax=Autumnicola musiva TaxID=3075589 RepID=A0ABU3D6E1_9FLAO|nr:DUF2141 domain-containing protein [Zunongwangia sp. F117]MDT0677099.1 DUF2141 domain-containing protein [Zunongwangia sp. F117]
MKLLPIFLSFFCGILSLNAQNNIEVEITDFESDKGQAMIGLYNTENSFLKKEFKGKQLKIQDKKVMFTFADIPEGNYAIMVFHDEDKNNELTTNFLGIPKENYGASNNAPSKFGPPKWKDAKFEVKNGKTLKQKIMLN